jgi:SAM-dependent methyltransferase
MSLKELAPTYFTRLHTVIQEAGRQKRILNAGCGDGVYDLYLKNKTSEIISIDINRSDIQIARNLNFEKNLLYSVADIGTMPFSSDVFDCVICTDVIEHLPDDLGAIHEMCRCLKKGGKLIITAPSKNFPLFYDPVNYVLNKFGKKLRIGIWGWGHERLYTTREVEGKTGLKLIKTDYLSKSLVGLFENSYVNSLFQKFTKNDPGNRAYTGRHVDRTAKTVKYEIHAAFSLIRDVIIGLDRALCHKSTRSVGIMAVFRK